MNKENKKIIKEKNVSEEKKSNVKFNILAIVSIIVFCFALSPVTLQNDTFYTIKIGELIVKNGVDMQDHFSWHENLPYTYPHWAYDTGIYLIYHLGEIMGIPNGGMIFIYISTIILACTLGILIYFTCGKITKNKTLSFFITLGILYLLKDFIAARAQLVTFSLFVLTILMIECFLETNKKRYLVGLVLISIAIANIHCAVWPFFFVLFLPYVAEYLICVLRDINIIYRIEQFYYTDRKNTLKKKKSKLQDKEKIEKIEQKNQEIELKLNKIENQIEKSKQDNKTKKQEYKVTVEKKSCVKWLILIMIICAITGLLTPIGTTPYTYLLNTMKGNTTKSISEHLPLTLYNDIKTMVVLVSLLAILIFTDTKIKLRDLFMISGLIFLAFMSRRQTSMLFLLGGFTFAKLINSLFNKYDKEGFDKLLKFMNKIIGRTLTLVLVLLIAFAIYKPKMKDKFVNNSSYPIDASKFIIENLDVENIKLFNEYNYGSYLLFKGIPVFIDSRADLYAPEFNKTKDIFSDYMSTSTIGTYYENKFTDYEITHVITKNNSKLNMFLSRDNNYIQLYKDDYFVIYQRGISL